MSSSEVSTPLFPERYAKKIPTLLLIHGISLILVFVGAVFVGPIPTYVGLAFF